MAKPISHTHLHLRAARGLLREQSGQATVEFALVIVLLLLLVFGITQFGLALNTVNDETNLASVAARFAAVNTNPSISGQSFAAWVKSQADTGLLVNGSTVCISFPNGTSNVGDPVRVSVSDSFAWQPLNGLSGLSGGAIPASSTLTGSATMRLEATPSAYSAGCA